MNYTYVSKWKPEAKNIVVPTNSRPFHNGDSNLGSIARVPFKPNPIKHWRKQLKPYYQTKSSKQISIDMINAPSTATKITSDDPVNCTSNYQLLKENIDLLNTCNGIRSQDSETSAAKCTGGSNHITRSGNTKLSKSYYRNHSKYLQAKCKTYEQNSMIGKKVDNKTNEYESTMCINNASTCKKNVIYKPSNSVFSTQGSVSSSTNTLRKRNIALTNNSQSLMTAYGRAPVSKRSYLTSDDSGYNIYYIKGELTNTKDCQSTHKVCKKA